MAAAAIPTTAPAIHAAQFDPSSPNPVVSWDGVPDAVKFRVQISDSVNFSSPLYQVDTVGLQATPPTNLPLTTLYWRVAGEDSAGHAGPYSDTSDPNAQFTTAWNRAPQQIAPADGDTLDFPTQPAVFSWQPLSGAKSYELQVDNSAAFVSPRIVKTSSTSYVLPDPQTPGQSYYWRVRGISADSSVVSQWAANPNGEARHYSVSWNAVPTNLKATMRSDLQSSGGPRLSDVTLTWDVAPGTARYQIQISPNRDFTNNITVDRTVDGAAYTPEPTLNNTSYYWRVRGIDAATPTAHNGSWSTVQTFTRLASPSPMLVAPAPSNGDPNGLAQITDTPTLSWTPVDHAAAYQLQISTDPSFTSTPICTTNHTEWTPLLPPDPCSLDTAWGAGVIYYWRVRGVDTPGRVDARPGVLGVWSSASQGAFRFVRTLTPTYDQPEDGATVAVPTMSWHAVSGALSYKVTVKNSLGTAVVNAVPTYSTSYTPAASALPAGKYSWYVQSVDRAGSVSGVPIGSARSFTVSGSPPAGSTPEPTSPASPVSQRMPALTWSAVAGATRYTVHYGANGFDQGTLTTAAPYPAFTSTGIPLSPGTYSWWVDAFSPTAFLSSSSTSGSFVITTPLTVSQASEQTRYSTPDPQASAPLGAPANDLDCTNAVCGDTPTFSWEAVPDATSYIVTVADDKDFTNIAYTYTTRYTTLTPPGSFVDSQAGQAEYWFVTPCIDFVLRFPTCGAGAQDPVAHAGSPFFRKRSQPVTLCPQDNHVASDPVLCPMAQQDPNPTRQLTFSWMDYLKQPYPAPLTSVAKANAQNGFGPAAATQSAKQYRLQVSNVADFSSLLEEVVVDGTTYTPTDLTYPVGPIYWRVQAIDNDDNALTWSLVWSEPQLIHRALPAPQQCVVTDCSTSPAASSTIVAGAPLLRWRPSDFAVKYNVELYPDTTFTPSAKLFAASGTSKFAAFAPQTALAPGTYAWRVQAVDAGNNPGPWYTDSLSTTDPNVDPSTFTFRIVTPAPVLKAPADNTHLSSGNVLFRWDAVDQAAQYQWQLSPTNLFGSGTISQRTVMNAWSPTTPFGDGTWYWRVQSLDAAGNVLASSAAMTLVKDATAPTVTALSPTTSVPVDGSLSATFSEPVTGVSPSAIQVVPRTGTSAVPGSVTASGTTATWTPSTALIPGETYTVTFTSAPRDSFGNALVPKSWTVRTSTSIDNTSPALLEHWDRDTATSASGGSYDSSRAAGSTASYSFDGSSIAVLGTRSAGGGYAAVYVDNVLQSSSVSFYSASTRYRQTVWSKTGLAPGSHRVTVRVLGTKPSVATDRWVYLDGFQVGATTIDQSSASVREAFARTTSTSASGGSYDTAQHATSGDTGSRPSYTAAFHSTSVSIYGVRSATAGKAAVYIDGALKSTIDLRATSTSVSPIYSVSGLSDRVHALRIDVVGTSSGSGSSVGIDYVRAV